MDLDSIRARLVNEFRQFIEAEYVIDDTETQKPFECDGLSIYRGMPLLVVLPETLEQVQRIMRACHAAGVPVIARGAGTGLCAGSTPSPEAVLLSMSRFDKIIEIDRLARSARVQPGVRNLAITEAAAAYGLFYGPDPSSQIACSIGGNIAENSGGVHCLKYGLTVHNVLEVQMVDVTGELVTLGGDSLDSSGFDLLALAIGSEGMLGVVTEIWVKLLPQPPVKQVLLMAFEQVSRAAESVSAIIASGLIPAGLEMMDELAIEAAEAFVHAGYPLGAKAILLCELDGVAEEVAADAELVKRIAQAHEAISLVSAEAAADQARLWAGRKAAFPAVGRLSPDYYCMDGTIPRHQLATVLEQINQLSDHYGLRVANVFHAGDGNLHPLILYDANVPGELEKAELMGGRILEICVEAGGTVTGEHGVGIEKLDQMCAQFADPELEQFFRVKAVFDPPGLLNPGKGVPTLARCAEVGGMHVHGGRAPFAGLERF